MYFNKTFWLDWLWFHIERSDAASSHVRGSSWSGWMTRSRCRAASAVMWGWCSQRMWRTAFPTFLLAGHRKSACSRFSTGCAWQPRDLQFGLAAEFVLCSLSMVTSSLCTSLKRKDVCSGPRPFNLVSLHEFSQSVSGLLSSILVGIKCPCLSPPPPPTPPQYLQNNWGRITKKKKSCLPFT